MSLRRQGDSTESPDSLLGKDLIDVHGMCAFEYESTVGRPVKSVSQSLWLPLVFLACIWTAIIIVINPVGEFMVNDDWAYVRCLESLMHTLRMETTGHGPIHASGGPALITHLLWGWGFVKIAGFSLTVLRVSVLTLGVLASVVLFLMLRRCGCPPCVSMVGTLSMVFNPLFLSQCFTFMTDITFTSFALVSVWLFYLGVEKAHTWIIGLGFLVALAATLTRQFGLVLPIGFVATCFLHSGGDILGRRKMVMQALILTIIPWMGYEILLQRLGSTPLSEHNVLHNAVNSALSMEWTQYVRFLSWNLFVSVLGYVCFFLSPILALRYRDFWAIKAFRYFVYVSTVVLVACEAMYALGMIDPPVILNGNVIFNCGVGPVVLKDTYILGITRAATLPKAIYFFVVYWTVIAAVVFGALAVDGVKNLVRREDTAPGSSRSFLATSCLFTALLYLAIIVPLAPYDRYLILPCALLIIWIVVSIPPGRTAVVSRGVMILVAAPLMCFAVFSVFGTRDFLEMKRSLTAAHKYVLNDLKASPRDVDGGFEFNGYHCYKKGMPYRKGLSWWWVERERYLITLGPLAGYHVIRTFPFQRWLGPDGSVHLLQPGEDR